ncbi:MAG: rRNA maturation RNase YbeY [Desulfonauticus sp.]|nr:rRNA maturation RNase YbeY [Desulfonauticus sp.]
MAEEYKNSCLRSRLNNIPSDFLQLHFKTNVLASLGLGKTELKLGFFYLGEYLNILDKSLSVVLVDDVLSAELNQRYLHCLGPTNVLSFPGDGEFLGELFINVAAVIRESFLYVQDRKEHFWRLTAHGVLHLLGYDHGYQMDTLTEELSHHLSQVF